MATATPGTAAARICNTDSTRGASGRTSRLAAIAAINPGGREPNCACATTSSTSTTSRGVARSAATAKARHDGAKSADYARVAVCISGSDSRSRSTYGDSFGCANVTRFKNDIVISAPTASASATDSIRFSTGATAAPSLHSNFAHTCGLSIST